MATHYIESIDFTPAAALIARKPFATVTNRKWKKQTTGVFSIDHNGGFWSVGHDSAGERRSMLCSTDCTRQKPQDDMHNSNYNRFFFFEKTQNSTVE